MSIGVQMEGIIFLMLFGIAALLHTMYCRENQRRITEINLQRARKSLDQNPASIAKQKRVRFYEQVYQEINGWHDLVQIENSIAKQMFITGLPPAKDEDAA
jgi:hypothetical protein